MTVTDNKYIVFKRDEFDSGIQHEVEDAVVIRRQDLAAPPILDAYANFYQAQVEMLEWIVRGLEDAGTGGGPLLGMIANAKQVATYFHEQAAEAWNADRKIPTV